MANRYAELEATTSETQAKLNALEAEHEVRATVLGAVLVLLLFGCVVAAPIIVPSTGPTPTHHAPTACMCVWSVVQPTQVLRSECAGSNQEATACQESLQASRDAIAAKTAELKQANDQLAQTTTDLATAQADLQQVRLSAVQATEEARVCTEAAAAVAAATAASGGQDECDVCEDCAPFRIDLEQHAAALQAASEAQEMWRKAHAEVDVREKVRLQISICWSVELCLQRVLWPSSLSSLLS